MEVIILIWFYSGTPGSGKSLHASRDIYCKVRQGKTIIGNMMINQDAIKHKGKGKYIYVNDVDLTPNYLFEYAKKHHKMGKEGQTLLIIDECQRLFGAREWNATGRKEWNYFFQIHRHYGFNVILMSQFDRLVDRQIRALFEYEVKHRKVNNYGIMGTLFGLICMSPVFVCVESWYGVKEITGKEFFRGKRKLYKLYDSYETFEKKENEVEQEKVVDIDEVGDNFDLEDLHFIDISS